MTDERTARDSMGEIAVPAAAYWDAQTARARQNFPISGTTPLPAFVRAGGTVKWATASANTELGLLDPELGRAIIRAAGEVAAGELADEFVVDIFQAGAGTSHHMNLNEVLASRAAEILGGERGDFSRVHPNDHVNFGQSTNDVIPTIIRIAALNLSRVLLENLDRLAEAFSEKAGQFDEVLKSGRTHLQDAVPVRLGQEFAAWAATLRESRDGIARARCDCTVLGIGGSATGTGLNTDPAYRNLVCRLLSDRLGEELTPAGDLHAAMQSMLPLVQLSGSLRALAVEVGRICNDLRLMASGPRTGLSEIELPPVQPGSSIMPGKVNPVICEMTNQVCFQVMGSDHVIALAAQAGQFELNVMMPILGHNLLWSLQIMASALDVLTSRCVRGITANRERCAEYAARTLGIVTALNPCLGYDAASEIAREAVRSGRSVEAVLRQTGLLSETEIAEMLDPQAMTEPGIPTCREADRAPVWEKLEALKRKAAGAGDNRAAP